MKKKTIKQIGAALVTAAVLTACSAGNSSSAPAENAYEEAGYEYESYDMADADEIYAESAGAAAMAPRTILGGMNIRDKEGAASGSDSLVTQTSSNGSDGGSGSGDTTPPQTDGPDDGADPDSATKRKLITTVSIEAETEELDAILQRVESEVTAFGGYIESSYIAQDRTYVGNNNYTNRRRASMTLRVPEAKLETILTTLADETNVLEESRTTEDITLTYVDIESRKRSLETQRESLLRLLEQAETVEDIITIEDRLSYVNYEIERMGGELRTYDNLVDYATVHLTLREVVEYTPVQEEPETVFSRITKGFSYNLKRVGGGIVDFIVWFISSLPQIALFAVVVAAAVKVLKWFRKRRDARRASGADGADKPRKGLRNPFKKKNDADTEKKSTD